MVRIQNMKFCIGCLTIVGEPPFVVCQQQNLSSDSFAIYGGSSTMLLTLTLYDYEVHGSIFWIEGGEALTL